MKDHSTPQPTSPATAHEMDLEEVIQQVRAGSLESFGEIVNHLQIPIQCFVYSRCPLEGDPDDVAQRVFLTAFRKIEQYEVGTNFRAWLFTIARFEILAERKRLQRAGRFLSRYESHLDDVASPESTSDLDVDRLDRLQHCIGRLDETATQALEWRYGLGMTLQEIANRRDRSVGAVKKQMHVLRKTLTRCLNQSDAAPTA